MNLWAPVQMSKILSSGEDIKQRVSKTKVLRNKFNQGGKRPVLRKL